MTARAMDFNCDLGESYGWWVRGADEVMMTCISSANVACGFHAGDATVMRATVARALEHGVAIGAHPGSRRGGLRSRSRAAIEPIGRTSWSEGCS